MNKKYIIVFSLCSIIILLSLTAITSVFYKSIDNLEKLSKNAVSKMNKGELFNSCNDYILLKKEEENFRKNILFNSLRLFLNKKHSNLGIISNLIQDCSNAQIVKNQEKEILNLNEDDFRNFSLDRDISKQFFSEESFNRAFIVVLKQLYKSKKEFFIYERALLHEC